MTEEEQAFIQGEIDTIVLARTEELRSQLAACVSVLRECRASLDADLPNAAELDAKLAALLEGKTNV